MINQITSTLEQYAENVTSNVDTRLDVVPSNVS